MLKPNKVHNEALTISDTLVTEDRVYNNAKMAY